MMRQGYVAEFASAEELLAAIRAMRAAGYSRLDAFTPYPVEGVDEALALRRSRLAFAVFPLAAFGALAAYLLQWYATARGYPLNVGGRPLHSWPAFIPIAFETAVLTSGFAAFVLTLALNRYPEPVHPIFDVPGFERASIDTFWLGIDRRDPRFEPGRTAEDLRSTHPVRVAGVAMEVP